jgi:hypothetical protein
MSEDKKESYYKQNLPNLIQRLKNSVDTISEIIDKDIEDDITDDKLFNVLKSKRQASEDVIWTLKRIDDLEKELNEVEEEKDIKKISTNPTKRYAQQANK